MTANNVTIAAGQCRICGDPMRAFKAELEGVEVPLCPQHEPHLIAERLQQEELERLTEDLAYARTRQRLVREIVEPEALTCSCPATAEIVKLVFADQPIPQCPVHQRFAAPTVPSISPGDDGAFADRIGAPLVHPHTDNPDLPPAA